MISLTSPTKTRAHSWPAALKLSALCIVTVVLFAIENPAVQAIIFCLVCVMYALPGKDFLFAGLRQIKLLWPFLIIVGAWHLWTQQLGLGTTIILRMLTAVGLANLVTMTTKLSDMIDVIHVLTGPLNRFGLKTRILELSIALVIRLTPVLVQKGTQLSQAWCARSHRSPGWRIILPFTVLALDDADQVAEALRARGGFDTMEEI